MQTCSSSEQDRDRLRKIDHRQKLFFMLIYIFWGFVFIASGNINTPGFWMIHQSKCLFIVCNNWSNLWEWKIGLFCFFFVFFVDVGDYEQQATPIFCILLRQSAREISDRFQLVRSRHIRNERSFELSSEMHKNSSLQKGLLDCSSRPQLTQRSCSFFFSLCPFSLSRFQLPYIFAYDVAPIERSKENEHARDLMGKFTRRARARASISLLLSSLLLLHMIKLFSYVPWGF